MPGTGNSIPCDSILLRKYQRITMKTIRNLENSDWDGEDDDEFTTGEEIYMGQDGDDAEEVAETLLFGETLDQNHRNFKCR